MAFNVRLIAFEEDRVLVFIRDAVRAQRRRPLFALVVILTVVVAVGLNLAAARTLGYEIAATFSVCFSLS